MNYVKWWQLTFCTCITSHITNITDVQEKKQKCTPGLHSPGDLGILREPRKGLFTHLCVTCKTTVGNNLTCVNWPCVYKHTYRPVTGNFQTWIKSVIYTLTCTYFVQCFEQVWVTIGYTPLVYMAFHVNFIHDNFYCWHFCGSWCCGFPSTVLCIFVQVASIIVAYKLCKKIVLHL